MPEYLTQKEAFLKCKKEGKFIVSEEIGIEKIKATLTIAESDVESADTLRKNISMETGNTALNFSCI